MKHNTVQNLIAALIAAAIATLIIINCLAIQPTCKVGIIDGPQLEIMSVVKKVAAKQGLNIQIIKFEDYEKPNEALANGTIDANIFQHHPYLDATAADRGYALTAAAKTIISPLKLYSHKYKSITLIKPGSTVAIPNDPVNCGRALWLLQNSGLITLKPSAGLHATITDIVKNPRQLTFKQVDAAETSSFPAKAELAVINIDYAIAAGLSPREALAAETGESPYATIIAVQTKNRDTPEIKKLIQAYHSDEVKQFIRSKYKASLTAAW